MSADDPDRADPASETVLLTAEQPFANHNGGQILFGPDGMLYIGLGDGGSGGDPGGRGQSLTDLLGAILRVDVRSGTGYTVPPDNPSSGRPTPGPRSGATASAIPGASASIRPPATSTSPTSARTPGRRSTSSPAAEGAGRGANFGWNLTEGRHCYASAGCDPTGFTLPVLEYAHGEGCSITGGYVYRGAAIPALQGHYFYADYCQGWVRSFRLQDGQAVEPPAVAHARARRRGAQLRAGRRRRALRAERGGTGIPDRAADSRRSSTRLAARLPRARSASGPRPGTIPGWRGLVYHRDYEGRGASARMLEEYAAFPLFRTVGIDSSFYAPPTEAVLAVLRRAPAARASPA